MSAWKTQAVKPLAQQCEHMLADAVVRPPDPAAVILSGVPVASFASAAPGADQSRGSWDC